MVIKSKSKKPSRRKWKRNYKSKKRASYRKGNRAIQSMHYKKGPFPKEFFTELTYADDVTLTATSGVPSTTRYCMNGLWDVNLTGTGNQPRYFDSLCGANDTNAPYRSYCVYASKISVTGFVNGSSSDSMGMRSLLAITPYISTSSAPSSISEILNRSETKSKWLGYWTSTQGVAKMSYYQNVKHWLGNKFLSDGNGAQANYGANPTNYVNWGITLAPADESSTVIVRLLVSVKFYVKFFTFNDVIDS